MARFYVFRRVQKGFQEDFMNNSVKMLKKAIWMKIQVDLSRPEKVFYTVPDDNQGM